MTHIAILLSARERPAVDAAAIAAARDALPGVVGTRRLDGDVAAALAFGPDAETGSTAIRTRLRAALSDRPVDVAIQPIAQWRKRLFLADMDSTMIGQECIDELADFVGLKSEVSAITERAMRGEIAFEPALRERVALLAGLDGGIVEEILRERIRANAGGQAFLERFRAAGGYSALVSGGFTLFTERVAAMLGFDMQRANRLEIDGEGRLTGRIVAPILGREAKRETLLALRTGRGLAPAEVMAIGDGANDLAMLAEAGLGIAYRAKPAVADAAHMRLDHADLSALIHLAGLTA